MNAVRDLGIDPRWKPFLGTPIFPPYVSGHATMGRRIGQLVVERARRDGAEGRSGS